MENALDFEKRISRLEADCQQVRGEVDSLNMRVTKHGNELDEMRAKNAANEAILTRIDDTVTKIDARLDDTAAKPAQRWDALVTQVIGLVVAALVGMALLQAGIAS